VIRDTPVSLPRLAPWDQDVDLDGVLALLPLVAAARDQVEGP